MITNLIIRLVSFVVCILLIVGGVMLSIDATKKNEELTADWQDVMETPFVPGAGN